MTYIYYYHYYYHYSIIYVYIYLWLYMHLILHSHVCNPTITCKFHKFSSLWLDQIPFAPAHQNDWWSMMEPRLFWCHASLPGSYVKGSLKWHTSPTSAASGQPFCYDKKSWWVPSGSGWVGLCQETSTKEIKGILVLYIPVVAMGFKEWNASYHLAACGAATSPRAAQVKKTPRA